jgi:uncharacterized RDD family membrane protein YckC
MRKILLSSFCGIILSLPIFLSAQSDESLPVAEPMLFDSAETAAVSDPMLIDANETTPNAEPMQIDLTATEVEATPAMQIEVLDDTVEVSDNAPIPTLYQEGMDSEDSTPYDASMTFDDQYGDEMNLFPPEKAAFVKKFATIFTVVTILVFYILFPVLAILLLILGARKNWIAKKKKENSVGYAGFWKRVAIHVFDKIIGIFLVPLFFSLYYYYRDGQTIGDKVFGAKIVDKKSHEVASVGKLMVRCIAKIPSLFALGTGFWPAGWRAEKNAWHDSLSDTRYISTKKTQGAWIVLTIVLGFVLPLLLLVPVVLFSLSQVGMEGVI